MWQVDQTMRRFDEAKELLVAFDVHARLRPTKLERLHPLLKHGEPYDPNQRRQAEAAFFGRLRASTEKLPLTRQICFEHIPPTSSELESALNGFLDIVGTVGNLETEDLEILVIRGELLSVLHQLRQDLDRQRANLESA
jgi:hypothetical protein